ncbi:Metallo-dependent phosphatase-like protein [Syncephalis pseudoplumigaleata]|uniref:Vacuolar protein sorting-associated protein 29 n=1 Tax=Syncephalis pseudoplumigaleata TaxID=1712513 RepID=A0A4P9YWT8_9FUNG|nr:Metallo-dependent phosphatase-like protein [Syncephalis pseudoplumigaleata]|eukprot:RKP24394.1 Metallo-dependent phosphatase-like protein [Syncephalis pseudoplumigaleata]
MSKVIQHGALRIGLVHGHQMQPWGDPAVLAMTAREMDVDVLVSGHTNQVEATERDGKFYINPGSATGALTSYDGEEMVPSFILMDVQNSSIVTYIYQLVDDEVKVEKTEYRKEM